MRATVAGSLFACLMHGLPCLANPPDNPSSICDILDTALPGKVAYPDTAVYNKTNVYWSRRQDMESSCIVLPVSPEEVSKTLMLVTKNGSPFTVKGGGHTPFTGASNIENGVVIALDALNAVNISPDLSTVSVGAGSRWINVSEAIEPLGLAVVGGRSPNVGVSGFLLGGGLSFLTGRRGFGCDNVRNFQVALVSGEIVNANPEENRDLYWALRGGGGSSFGIVTRFDLETYKQGDIWSRLTVWPASEAANVLGTFSTVTKEKLHSGQDPDSHLMYGLAYPDGAEGDGLVTTVYGFHLNLSSPHAPGGESDTMEGFTQLPAQLMNNTLVSNLTGQVRHLSRFGEGKRETWYATSIRDGSDSRAFLADITTNFTAFADELRAAGDARKTAVHPSIVFQPLTNPSVEAMQRNGGNPTGLKPSEFPSYIISVPTTWTDPALDDFIETRTNQFVNDLSAMAKARGFGNGYEYMNYAGKLQDVIASYGEENQVKLQAIARKYDPDGLLRKLWEGYFKP
ncbi:FAD binding domain-containing protein [Colletotrichum tabaci]|uniref:FAD binding domain-containing protein n=1 Tax=Colletotrichum tabaci TaxID=1209068 RepID=A0AAV9TAH5_9PEZI